MRPTGISLSDRVFGEGAITGTDFREPPFNPGVEDITVEHLLTHTCGGWSNATRRSDVQKSANEPARLIAWTLDTRPLDYPPGQHYDYSNFGYCVLGRVIEKVTRQPYADYVRTAVLKRCGVSDMTIAGNTLAQRQPHEVKYYGQGGNPYGMNVTRMDSSWRLDCDAPDLVQFFMHVDGFPAPPNILKPADDRNDDHRFDSERRLCQGLGGQQGPQLVAQWLFPRHFDHRSADQEWICWAAFTNTRANSAMDSDPSAHLDHGGAGQSLESLIEAAEPRVFRQRRK